MVLVKKPALLTNGTGRNTTRPAARVEKPRIGTRHEPTDSDNEMEQVRKLFGSRKPGRGKLLQEVSNGVRGRERERSVQGKFGLLLLDESVE